MADGGRVPWLGWVCACVCASGKGKPAGLNAGRKLLKKRRDERWADKKWKKDALGTTYKVTPFQGASHAKGIALEKVGVESKQPNSAIRKCIRVQLIKNGKKVTAFVPMDGCLNFIEENVRKERSATRRTGQDKGVGARGV